MAEPPPFPHVHLLCPEQDDIRQPNVSHLPVVQCQHHLPIGNVLHFPWASVATTEHECTFLFLRRCHRLRITAQDGEGADCRPSHARRSQQHICTLHSLDNCKLTSTRTL